MLGFYWLTGKAVGILAKSSMLLQIIGPVIIPRPRGGGGGDLGEEHLIWLEGSVVTENPKAIAENFGRIQREDH